MSTVVEQIEQQIAKLSSKAIKKNTGTIRAVADGVAKLDGLSDVMYNEMVQFRAAPSASPSISKLTKWVASSSVTSRNLKKATKFRPPANFSPYPSVAPCSVASSMPLAGPLMAKARSIPKNFIR